MQIYLFEYERNYFNIAPTCIGRGITKSRVMKEVILVFILAVINFLIFSYDIEVDKDFFTWLWLLNSIICLIGSAVLYTNHLDENQ